MTTLSRKGKLWWCAVLGAAACLLLLASMLPVLNGLLLPLFALGLFSLAESKISNSVLLNLTWLLTVAVGFFIAIHRPENFSYPLLWHADRLYADGQAFSLYVNTSKALGGYLVLLWLLSRGTDAVQYVAFPKALVISGGAGLFVLLIASVLFDVEFHPKLPAGTMLFIAVNLGVTVLAEEAFFRLLLQRHIASWFGDAALGPWIAGGVAALLFALAHTETPGPAMLLFLIAGAAYSAVFALSGRLSMAILTHFGVNILHFLLLEYPLPLS